jgi:hypothetical protein
MTVDDIKKWGALALGAGGFVLALWNRFGIKRLDIKTDGLMSFRSRADRAEGKLEEQSDVRERKQRKHDEAQE